MTDVRAQLEADAEREAAEKMMQLAVDYLAASRDRANPVSSAHDQQLLARAFDEPMPLRGASLDEVIDRIRREVIPDSNWLYHPRAMGPQVAPPLPAAIWSEAVIAALNNSTAVSSVVPTGDISKTAVELFSAAMTASLQMAAGKGGATWWPIARG